jgi:curved DNA-binding protein CbpA
VDPRQPDYYALLDIGRSASAAEIDRAYRRAARATHPDINPDDTSAGERFNAVTIAYETLSNPQRRASYDRAHPSIRPDPHSAVYRAARPAAPVHLVHLGRRPPRPEPLQPFRESPAATSGSAGLFELVTALSRLIERWPFP